MQFHVAYIEMEASETQSYNLEQDLIISFEPVFGDKVTGDIMVERHRNILEALDAGFVSDVHPWNERTVKLWREREPKIAVPVYLP